MKVHLLCLFLLQLSLFVSVQSKPHGEHESLFSQTHGHKEKDTESPDLFDGNYSILPTLFSFEASSPEPEGDEIEKGALNGGEETELVDSGALGVSDEDLRSTVVLLSDEELNQLLQASELEQQDVEQEGEEDGDKNKMVAETKEFSIQENHAFAQHIKEDQQEKNEKELKEEDVGSSTDSEIPMDMDYASDGEATDSLNTKLEEKKILIMKLEEESKSNDEIPRDTEDYSSQLNQDDESPEKDPDALMHTKNHQDKPEFNPENDQSKADEGQVEDIREVEFQNKKSSIAVAKNDLSDKKRGEKGTNESDGRVKEKGKKKRKRHQRKKVQSGQTTTGETSSEHAENQEPDEDADSSMVQRAHKRKNKEWGPLLGLNPVQVRATVDLFPRITAKPRARANGQDADLCENFPCKRGKICKLKDEKPSCVCQDPADCPPSSSEFDHVCGSDNQTYNSACQLFATKCSLEGSKKGHRLHLDYTGSCKFISPCPETELVQFPLRMRDWLKNVLLQLYEHDFLTPKQRSRVQKIYESERRLSEGDHPIELLALDFEKNYNMYIYPVHWQFAQMDQHPSDGALSHSELAPLRAPLVPMEHCTSVFLKECDTDKDKLLSFREWCRCFGIKDEDVDDQLLF